MTRALVLAAGEGTRLGAVTGGTLPKCLVPVGGRPLLGHLIEALSAVGLTEVTVVTGASRVWTEGQRDRVRALGARCVVNERSTETQSPDSLRIGLEAIGDGPVLAVDGDLWLTAETLRTMVDDPRSPLLLCRYCESRAISNRGSKVEADAEGRVLRSANGLATHWLYSGVVKLGAAEAAAYVRLLGAEPQLARVEMGAALDRLRAEAGLHAVCVNTDLSVVEPASTAAWEAPGGARQQIRIGERTVVKRAEAGRAKLLRELDWFERAPESWRPHLPRIVASSSGDDWAEYTMERLPWPDLATVLLADHGGWDGQRAVFRKVVEFLCTSVWPADRQPTPAGWLRRDFLDKLRRRLPVAAGRSASFAELARAPRLAIDGRVHRGATLLVESILGDVRWMAAMEPPFVGAFHGDCKPDNVLVEPGGERFVLIDPRGATPSGSRTSDYVEDVAKLRTSLHSGYDLIVRGELGVERDGEQIVGRRSARAARALDRLRELDRDLLARVDRAADLWGDPDWRDRCALIEALLLLANAPFQITDGSEREVAIATALYTRGTVLLSELLQRRPLDPGPRHRLVNVNAPADLELAERLSAGGAPEPTA